MCFERHLMLSNLLTDIQPANQTGISPGKTFDLGLGPSVLAALLYRFSLCQCQQSLSLVEPPASKQTTCVCDCPEPGRVGP